MKKLFFFITLLSLVLIFYPVHQVYGAVCGEEVPTDEGSLRDYISSCKQQLEENRGAQATLSSAISYLNNQINLTQAQVYETQQELDSLNLEITELSGKIDSLDYSLDDLTKLFVERVQAAYKEKRSGLDILAYFNASGFSDFFRQYQYVNRVRDHDREVMIALESARLDFDKQKSLKEEKQLEVEALRSQLGSQQASLNSQKLAKDKLLADTKNDEKKYAQLLSSAQSQLAAFSRFISNQGGAGILSGQTKCNDWGCYYDQREADWGNLGIGLSSSSMREYGCLVTSMAMVATHYGKSLNPGNIASSGDPFWSTSAFMLQGSWSVNGVTMTRTRLGSATSHIDEELAAGRPVVVGIYGGPDHFLVIKGKEGDDYIMHDPYPAGGADIKFSSKYPLSAISTVDRVTVN